MIAGAQLELAVVEVNRHQLRTADIDGQRGRARGRVAIVGQQRDGCQAGKTIGRLEAQRAAITGDAGLATGAAQHAQAQAVVLGIADHAAQCTLNVQLNIGFEQGGAQHRCLVGRIAQVGVQKLGVAGVVVAVEVDICRRVEHTGAAGGGHAVGIAAVYPLVAIDITGHEQAQRIRTTARSLNQQLLQARRADAEQRISLVALHPAEHRLQAGQAGQRRHQVAARALHHDAQQHGSTGAGADLAGAHREGVTVDFTGRQRAVVHGAQVVKRSAQVGRQGMGLNGWAAVVIGHSGRAIADQLQPPRAVIAVAGRAGGTEIAGTDQPAMAVVVVVEDAAVGRDDGADAAGVIAHKSDHVAVGGGDAAVGNQQAHTVGISDAADLALGDVKARAIGRHQGVLGPLGDKAFGVVGQGAVQRVVAAGRTQQFGRHRFKLPGHAGIGHPACLPPAQRALGDLLAGQREAGALAAGQRDKQPGAFAQRWGVAVNFAATGLQIGDQVQIAPGAAPAQAELTHPVSGQ